MFIGVSVVGISPTTGFASDVCVMVCFLFFWCFYCPKRVVSFRSFFHFTSQIKLGLAQHTPHFKGRVCMCFLSENLVFLKIPFHYKGMPCSPQFLSNNPEDCTLDHAT